MHSRASLHHFIAVVLAAFFLLGPPATGVAAGKYGTRVGQVNGTPSARPGGSLTIEVGLSRYSGSVGYSACHSGPVDLYLASGGTWVYRTTVNAWGCYGTPNSYGLARFPRKISATAARRKYLRYKFVYRGDVYHYGSVGYGQIYIR